MLDLLLAIGSSAAVSAMLRIGEARSRGMYARFAMNYASAALLAFLAMPVKAFPQTGYGTALGLGAAQGVMYLLTLVILQANIRKNGVILSATFARLGLIVPMVFAVAAFGEIPSGVQMLGFLLACGAIWMMRAGQPGKAASRGGLLILLLCNGLTDSLAKIFEQTGSRNLDGWFLLITFLVALVVSLGMMVYRREKLGWREILYGCLVGIPNYGSVFFLLRALTHLPAVLVYPTYSAGTILAVSLIGAAAFRERLERRQWLGLGVILLALILLNL